MKTPISMMLKMYYDRKKEIAQKKLRALPKETAKVKLDFKSLNIAPKIDNPFLYLNPNDEGISVDLYAWGFREPINTHMLFRFISEEKRNIDAVIDIGSNLGYFPTIELASGARQVIAIEPVPETYAFLKENINRFKNSKALNVAISDKKENLKMYIPTKLNLATVLAKAVSMNIEIGKVPIKEIVNVQALSLENIVKSEGLTNANVLIRMDIEGFEREVLKNIPKEVYGLSFELHAHILGYEATLTLLKKLHNFGYKIRTVVRETQGLYPIIKWLGLRKALQLYQKVAKKTRILNKLDPDLLRDMIRYNEVSHIFAVRSEIH